MDVFGLLIDPRVISAIGMCILAPIMGWMLKLTIAKDKRERARMQHEEKRFLAADAQVSQLRDFYLSARDELKVAREYISQLTTEREKIRQEKHDERDIFQAKLSAAELKYHELEIQKLNELHAMEMKHEKRVIELEARIRQLEAKSP